MRLPWVVLPQDQIEPPRPLPIRGTELAVLGFPEESEKFLTLVHISLLNNHLWTQSKNAG
jgi:hypothetical protein